MADETKEEQKPEPVIPTYRDKIDSLLARVSKGEIVYPKPASPVVVPENPTYKKIKELGGIQKGLPELFKIEESAFDVPHYVNDESDGQVVGSSLFHVKPPSSHLDADQYWARMAPHLKRIGKLKPHEGEQPGTLELLVLDSKGEEETLKISLVRDEEHGDRPTLIFEYENRDDITPEEVTKFVTKAGLKADRMEAKQLKGVIVMDVLDK